MRSMAWSWSDCAPAAGGELRLNVNAGNLGGAVRLGYGYGFDGDAGGHRAFLGSAQDWWERRRSEVPGGGYASEWQGFTARSPTPWSPGFHCRYPRQCPCLRLLQFPVPVPVPQACPIPGMVPYPYEYPCRSREARSPFPTSLPLPTFLPSPPHLPLPIPAPATCSATPSDPTRARPRSTRGSASPPTHAASSAEAPDGRTTEAGSPSTPLIDHAAVRQDPDPPYQTDSRSGSRCRQQQETRRR